jgi:hypothetical protein
MYSITNVSVAILKQLFIMYGADSYDMSNNQEDQGNQTTHIETIYNYITTAVQVSFATCVQTVFTCTGINLFYKNTLGCE